MSKTFRTENITLMASAEGKSNFFGENFSLMASLEGNFFERRIFP